MFNEQCSAPHEKAGMIPFPDTFFILYISFTFPSQTACDIIRIRVYYFRFGTTTKRQRFDVISGPRRPVTAPHIDPGHPGSDERRKK